MTTAVDGGSIPPISTDGRHRALFEFAADAKEVSIPRNGLRPWAEVRANVPMAGLWAL